MLRARVLAQQLSYRQSPTRLSTAQAIITAKVRNGESLLARYVRSRRRAGYASESLQVLQNRLTIARGRIAATSNHQALFLLEARAASAWWRAVALVCHQPDWRRHYPHATDPLNMLLNVGYTMLGRQCAKALAVAGLEPALGVYHGENSGTPLVWDFEEIFRHIAVDEVILPFFSRRPKSGVEPESKIYNKILGRLAGQYRHLMWYEGRCERLERIIQLEAVKLRRAIIASVPYKPFHYRWGHRQKCKIKPPAVHSAGQAVEQLIV